MKTISLTDEAYERLKSWKSPELEIYAFKKRNELIGPHDLWIAACALQKAVPLVSRNKMEFERVPSLALEVY